MSTPPTKRGYCAALGGGAQPDRRGARAPRGGRRRPTRRSKKGKTPEQLANAKTKAVFKAAAKAAGKAAPRLNPESLKLVFAAARALGQPEMQFFASQANGQLDEFLALLGPLEDKVGTLADLMAGAQQPWQLLAWAMAVRNAGLQLKAEGKPGETPLFVAGDLKLKSLDVQQNLVVAGDLSVAGPILQLERGVLVVAGDVTCTAFVTDQDAVIGGTLTAKQFVWGDSSDSQLTVGRDAVTPLLVSTEHALEARGAEKAARRVAWEAGDGG